VTEILLGLGALALCVLVIYLLAPRKPYAAPPSVISLHYSRVTPSPEELHRLFVGEVVSADVLPGCKGFALTYAMGRTVQITIVEPRGEDPFLTAEEAS
jgi:hypothetical protein